jgi:hypothetical protein
MVPESEADELNRGIYFFPILIINVANMNGFADHTHHLHENDFEEPKNFSVKTFDAFRTHFQPSRNKVNYLPVNSQNETNLPHKDKDGKWLDIGPFDSVLPAYHFRDE